MKIFIAEDDAVCRRVLQESLALSGHDLLLLDDGAEAWELVRRGTRPDLAVLDWMMPGLDGIELTRRLRSGPTPFPPYILIVTCRDGFEDTLEGFRAGADDYITKPFSPEELRARVQVGVRVVGLQAALGRRVAQLEEALGRVKRLQGLLPICSYCKSIRNDQNYWQQVEAYIAERTEAEFSHGVCPACYARFLEREAPEIVAEEGAKR